MSAAVTACQANNDCGTGVVAKALTPRENLFFVKSPLQLLEGQKVKIAVSEQHLLSAAALLYLLPLFCLIAVAALLSRLQLAESAIVLGSLTALVARFWRRPFFQWPGGKARTDRNPRRIARPGCATCPYYRLKLC